MCTASWFFTDDGYELFFNRDELRTRLPATPPAQHRLDGIEALLPTDTDAGGTWIAVNRYGVSVALLNRYQDSADPGSADRRRSRGLLVRDLASERSAEAVLHRVQGLELSIYAPFTLLVLEPGSRNRVSTGGRASSRRAGSSGSDSRATRVFWTGQRLSSPATPTAPLASSGHDPRGVPATRLQLWHGAFRQAPVDGPGLLDFHRCHRPDRGAHSPCMHRPDARTVSLTRVRVDGDRVSMAYAPGPPCEHALTEPVTLERLSSAAAA